MTDYKPRILDSILQRKLLSKGAVLIEGPKWCGKTTTAEQFASSKIMLSKPSTRDNFRQMLEIDSDAALDYPAPTLIDEWQTVPKLWDTVRYTVDFRKKFGQFILTGSAVPDKEAEKEIEHSGAGRFAWLKMRPMSLFESGESNGKVSLTTLFNSSEVVLAKNNLSLRDIAFLICRGGWPLAVGLPEDISLEQAMDYYDAVTKEDIVKYDGVKRSSTKIDALMRAYARHQGTQVSIDKLKEDLVNNDATSMDDKTISSYLDILRKIFVIEDMEAWNPNIRSKTAIRSSNTRYFIDSSIATSALRIGPDDLLNDLNTMGFLFETLCVRDLRVYADALGGNVFHYRDKNGLECDAVIHLRTGEYGLIEIKLGGETAIEQGAKNINLLESQIDTSKMKAPSFKMILTATGEFAYRRKSDGVYVVPVGCLRP